MCHTHFRYDQNRNSVPKTIPMRFATLYQSPPWWPRTSWTIQMQTYWNSSPTPLSTKNITLSRVVPAPARCLNVQ